MFCSKHWREEESHERTEKKSAQDCTSSRQTKNPSSRESASESEPPRNKSGGHSVPSAAPRQLESGLALRLAGGGAQLSGCSGACSCGMLPNQPARAKVRGDDLGILAPLVGLSGPKRPTAGGSRRRPGSLWTPGAERLVARASMESASCVGTAFSIPALRLSATGRPGSLFELAKALGACLAATARSGDPWRGRLPGSRRRSARDASTTSGSAGPGAVAKGAAPTWSGKLRTACRVSG